MIMVTSCYCGNFATSVPYNRFGEKQSLESKLGGLPLNNLRKNAQNGDNCDDFGEKVNGDEVMEKPKKNQDFSVEIIELNELEKK